MSKPLPVLTALICATLCLCACHRAEPAADNDGGADMTLADPVDYTAAQKAAIQATFPAPFNKADLAEGEQEFNKCRACHTITPDKMNMTGPHLYGVFGRKSGTVAGYTFTEAMTRHNVIWGFDTLDTYLTSPQTVVKGTKMGFQGLPDPVKRRNLIAYLALESQPHPGISNAATSSSSAP